MSVSTQEYANLSSDAYRDYNLGVRSNDKKETITIEGIQYTILEHKNNPKTGYQGTIYQKVEKPNDIIVAHRGSEFDKQPVRDGLLADMGMVTTRQNTQARDAIELTRNALKYAKQQQNDCGEKPSVTVTGHSLGGCLAQITSHYFNLKGETFNPYGAVSLNRRIPEGGENIINHIMAGDLVSAVSPHHGKTIIYARQNEIDLLTQSGYKNNHTKLFDLRNPISAATQNIDSHSLSNFLNTKDNSQQSILSDNNAIPLGEQYYPMINKYREDLEGIRAITSLVSNITTRIGAIRYGVELIQGNVEPGEPERLDNLRKNRELADNQNLSENSPYLVCAIEKSDLLNNQDSIGQVNFLYKAIQTGDISHIQQAMTAVSYTENSQEFIKEAFYNNKKENIPELSKQLEFAETAENPIQKIRN